MLRFARAFSVAAIAALIGSVCLGVAAEPAFAEGDPTLSISDASQILTLPSDDGYRDAATATITASEQMDVAVVVIVSPTSSKSVDPDVALTANGDGTFGATVSISDLALPAGSFQLQATDLQNTPVVATGQLTVGSGAAEFVSVTTTNGTIFHPGIAGENIVAGSVSAEDETGIVVPFSGNAHAGTANASVTGSDGASGSFSLNLSALPLGTVDLIATVDSVDSSAVQLTLSSAVEGISGLGLTSDVATLYPAVDHYRDSVTFTVTPTIIDATAPFSGALTISQKGKSVATFPLASSATTTIEWNGKVKGKIKAGTYVATASATAGNTVASPSLKITVSAKKLTAKYSTVSHRASSVITSYEAEDEAGEGECDKSGSKVGCIGYDALEDDNQQFSLYAYGSVSVPSAVRTSEKYHAASVVITAHVSHLYNSVTWVYGENTEDATFSSGALKKGTHRLKAATVSEGAKSVALAFGLSEYSYFIATKFDVKFKYYVLK